jgi:hypothetical protein
VNVDRRHRLIRRYAVTDAAEHDVSGAGVSMDTFMADALAELDDIERIDRLTSIAESRRQECLSSLRSTKTRNPLREPAHATPLIGGPFAFRLSFQVQG